MGKSMIIVAGSVLLLVTTCLAWIVSIRDGQPKTAWGRVVVLVGWISLIGLGLDLGWLGGLWLADINRPIKITSPGEGQAVDARLVVKGRTSPIPEGQALWVVVQSEDGTYAAERPYTILIQPDGSWSATIFIGDDGDEGKLFSLLAVVTPAHALSTDTNQPSEQSLGALLPGGVVVDRISVRRK